EEFDAPLGEILLMPQKNLKDYIDKPLEISYRPVEKMIACLGEAIEIQPGKDQQSYIVNLSLNSALPQKAVIILNTLVEEYNADISNDKKRILKATSDFINSRLNVVSKDMESADRDVAEFKGGNRVMDMSSEPQLYLNSAAETETKLIEVQTQLQVAEMMRSSLEPDNSELLPSNMGLENAAIENTITKYNEMVLERDDLLKSATPDNPVVENINRSLGELNRSLTLALDNYDKGLQMRAQSLEKQLNEFRGKLSNMPGQEANFSPIMRQQQIVESLYLFLLEKREETEIKGAATPHILKVIDEAYSSDKPVAPRRMIILLASLIMGFLIPFGILYIKFLLDNKVQSRKDVEEMVDAPVLVELPGSEEPIVRENDRSALAESFRILRTNMGFMLGEKSGKGSTIFVTSTLAGEGKTFVATNIARILSLSGKKVLLIGADIRKPRMLEYLGIDHLKHTNIGITQFLASTEVPVEHLKIEKPADYKFDLIYSGYAAPNPAE